MEAVALKFMDTPKVVPLFDHQDDVLSFSGMEIGNAYSEDDMLDVKEEQAAEPIKNIDDINKLRDYLLKNEKYRDYLMLMVGINTGLRYSDFIRLKFVHLIDPNKIGTDDPFREEVVIEEQKTKNTKKHRVNRHIAINKAIKVAVMQYLAAMSEAGKTPELGDYMFTSNSNNGGKVNKPMNAQSIRDNFKRYAKNIGMDINFGTHTFRKTFGYQFMRSNNNDTRALCLLQQTFNHSSANVTLRYIGLTADEIRQGYEDLCLGL